MAAIKREDLDAGRVDLSDVVDRTAAPLPPVNPGQVLRGEFLEPLELSAAAVARAIGVPRNRRSGILNGSRARTAHTALRLGTYFGISAEFWLSLQASYDLKRARREIGERLRREITPRAA
ncbi:MAG: HigA family addiction module antitoxin [Gammaproteobacteria bacterium]